MDAISEGLFESDGRAPGSSSRPDPRLVKDLTLETIRDSFDSLKKVLVAKTSSPLRVATTKVSSSTGKGSVASPQVQVELAGIDSFVKLTKAIDRLVKASPLLSGTRASTTRQQDRSLADAKMSERLDKLTAALKANTQQGGSAGGNGLLDVAGAAGGAAGGKTTTAGKAAGKASMLSKLGKIKAPAAVLAGGGLALGAASLLGLDREETLGTALTGGAVGGGGYLLSRLLRRETATAGLTAASGGTSALSKAGGLLGRAAVPLQFLLAGTDAALTENDSTLTRAEKNVRHSGTGGGLAGGLAGAALGAAAGSVVPVVGTAIGGLVGGIAGSFGGNWLGEKTAQMIVNKDSPSSELLFALKENTKATIESVTPLEKISDPSWLDSVSKSVKGATYTAISRATGWLGNKTEGAATMVTETTQNTPVEPIGRAVGRGLSATGKGLGFLSAMYEGKVGSANRDNIGSAYGKYQFNSATGGLSTFMKANPEYAAQFEGLTPGTPEFDAKWRQVAKSDPSGFEAAQDKSATALWYKPAESKASQLGFKTGNRGVQEAVFSGAINHGGIQKILANVASQPGFLDMPAEKQIEAFYAARREYVQRNVADGKTQDGLMRRYASEEKKAAQLATIPVGQSLSQGEMSLDSRPPDFRPIYPVSAGSSSALTATGRTEESRPVSFRKDPTTPGAYSGGITAQDLSDALSSAVAAMPQPSPAVQVASSGNSENNVSLDSIPLQLDDLGLVIFNTPKLS